jgi:hypothetical protein
MSGTVNLSTHIEDILSVFRYERIEQAVLASHSYGGMLQLPAGEVAGFVIKRADMVTFCRKLSGGC